MRRTIVELLLSDHPKDCLVCSNNGRCELQRVAAYVGVRQVRFQGERRSAKVDHSNPFFERDEERCILCGKCVRVCDEIQGRHAIDYAYRGLKTKVATGLDRPINESTCESCGQCVQLCPTGALRTKNSVRYGAPTHEETTICPYCGVGCGLILEIRGDRIIDVRGDPDNPVSHGSTCVKGRFGWDYVEHEERFTKPLVRKGGVYVEAGWDEVLDLVADRFAEIVRRHGPDALAFLSSAKCTNEENYLVQKLARGVIGTNNVDHCARLCHSSTVTGLVTAFGSGAMTNSIDDIAERAAAYFIIGSNTTENHPVIGARIRRAVKKRGAKLIVADPRRIPLTEMATLHLRQRPGTDIALLNGIMYVLIAENLYDAEYVARRTEGFEQLKEVVALYPPDRVQEITGVLAEQIVEAAHILAENRPGALLYAMGITQHTTGHQNVLACADLQMLLGNVGVPGGGVNPLRGQNNVQGACDMGCLVDVYPGYQSVGDLQNQHKFANAWGKTSGTQPGLTLTEMLNAADRGAVRGLFVLGEDPAMTDPDLNHARQALDKVEFLVVQEILPTETTAYADAILPGAAFAEKEGTFTNTERRVQRVRQAVDPPGKARPDWQILAELGRRMQQRLGLDPEAAPYAAWRYTSPEDIMDEIATLTPIYAGIRYERLETEGGLQWPVPTLEHPGTPILHETRFSRGLGRFVGVEWVPPAEEPDDEYPFVLTTGRVLYHFHGGAMSRRSEGLNALYPEAQVELNAADARALGIHSGDRVRITSRRGQITARAQVVERLDPGVIFIPFHFHEAAANLLTNAALDPVAKIPELKVCAVRLEKA
ncbi:MAG: formate dehydrogenase subunit alpha [Chloroflexi bacterium]|nr:formate dehydrogenase subunit alpha [Chloroflexota bacterium]